MLSASQRKIIRNMSIYEASPNNQIPSPDEIFKKMKKQILNADFSHVELSNPKKANCIIRVFWKVDYKYEDFIFNLYGAICYTKKWFIGWRSNEIPFKSSEYGIRIWLCQDDYIDIETDFVDFFVKISM